MKQNEHIFLIAGRTGGPIVPLLAIAKNLPQTPVILGVLQGVETRLAEDNGVKIEYLPEAKFALGSFKNTTFLEKIKGFLDIFTMAGKLFLSIIKSIFLLLKYRPKAVFSAGSFLAVPVIFSVKFLSFFGVKIKIITHQQDPLPGLANKLTFPHSDLKTCVFEYSKKFRHFQDAKIIPNPINTKLFEEEEVLKNLQKIKQNDPILYQFLTEKKLPILLVMGGGSGSQFLNEVVWREAEKLQKNFKILHLTGALQEKTENKKEILPIFQDEKKYLSRVFLTYEYHAVLKHADLVLARPGLGTITELLYLKKPAILVPIPFSHQEKNAKEVQNYFTILDQKTEHDWQENLQKTFQNGFGENVKNIEKDLQEYYLQVKNLIEKK